MQNEREQWFPVGSGVWVFATTEARKARGWYARARGGQMVRITKLSSGKFLLEITVKDNRWEVEQRTEHESIRAAKAQAKRFLAHLSTSKAA